ncbi:MAG TPA: M6 family metalloprotease domain-containing protein [Pyrinomonadaceae bacterium]
MKKNVHRYEHGPTTCSAAPDVVENVKHQIQQSFALSRGDVRLAAAMGLVTANVLRPLGFNDGVFYPPEEAGTLAAHAPLNAPPSDVLSLSTPAAATRNLHALALMVDFSDNVGTRPAAEFERMLFDPTNPDSMTSIYKELSYGKLKVTGEVIGYIRAPRPYSFYTNGQSGTGTNFPNNTPGLLVDALTEFCRTDSLARFDTDGDGFVDGIFLIHAGGGAEAEPDPAVRPHKIWSHKWLLPTSFVNNGVRVSTYSTEPEDGRVGVFSHEFGHVLGLPDLYDSNYLSKGIGNWCLMSGGSWGGGGNKPVRMSCWCLAKLGWIKPTNVKTARTIQLKTLASGKSHCYRLWSKGKSGPEYFLIENRQKTGRDSALPGSGMALWHVDERQPSNTNPLSYLVGLVQADGKRDLEFNRNDGDTGDLFPGSKNVKQVDDATMPSTRANDGTPTGVSLKNIAENTGEITVDVKV